MSLISVWVDREHAKLFKFTPETLERETINHAEVVHHRHDHGQKDVQVNEHQLFVKLVPELQNAEQILILGPGLAKQHLNHFLRDHHPGVFKKVRSCEAIDHPTDKELIALSRKIFDTEVLK